MLNTDNVSSIPDERLRRIVSEVFANIIKKYGEKNFLRWINEKKIDEKIKKLIIKYTNPKLEPNAGGYYDPVNEVVAVQEEYGDLSTLSVLTHEFNHFLTAENFKKEMTGFINEGITEYLKQSVEPLGYKTYQFNVDLTVFLHKQLGDILIKSYFTGNTVKVKEKLSKYLAPTSLDLFFETLEKIYDGCYKKDAATRNEILRNNIPFFVNSYMSIYLGKIREDADNMEFYSNGNIDIEKINKLLDGISSVFPSYITRYINNQNMMDSYKKQIVRAILERSHLRYSDYYNEDNLSRYIDAILRKDRIQIPNENAIQTLLMHKIGNKKLNLNEYADAILLIVSKFPNFPIEYLKKMEFIKIMVGEDKFDSVCEYVKNNINRCNNINEFVTEHEKNTIESYFRTIIPDHLYLELRDNKFYIVELDINGKVTKETPIDMDEKHIYIDRWFAFDNDGHACKISIQLDEGLSNIKIYPDNLNENNTIYTLDGFQKLMKVEPFFAELRSSITRNKRIDNDSHEPFYGVDGIYYLINNCGIRQHDDYRTIHIDLEGLKKDLDRIFMFFSNDKLESKIKNILKEYLCTIYQIENSAEINWCVDTLYGIICQNQASSSLLDIEGLLNNLKNQKNDFIASKYELQFKNKEAKEEYYKRKAEYELKMEKVQRRQEERKAEEEKKAKEQEIANFEKKINRSYLIYKRKKQYANPDVQFDLPAKKLYSGKREPGFATLDVDNLIEDLKSYTRVCDGVKDPKPFIIKKLNSAIKELLEEINTEEEQKFQVTLYDMLYNSIINGQELNREKYEIEIKKINEHISGKGPHYMTIIMDEKREVVVGLMNELYNLIEDKTQFEAISRRVHDCILQRGYDESIVTELENYIGLIKNLRGDSSGARA